MTAESPAYVGTLRRVFRHTGRHGYTLLNPQLWPQLWASGHAGRKRVAAGATVEERLHAHEPVVAAPGAPDAIGLPGRTAIRPEQAFDWWRERQIAVNSGEIASRNSLSIPASQKVADPRVSSGAYLEQAKTPQNP